MAIPPELPFASEAEFIDRFLIPLLQRLGFSLIVHYHGAREFGKDIVFAEIDRFGHVRYHGLQAKFEPSIGVNSIEGLITDCKQAFANPFQHPQTGQEERISTYYAANGGSFPDTARTYFFNALLSPYGGNVRLLDGKALVELDRWATVSRIEAVAAVLNGLAIEVRYNRWLTPFLVEPDGVALNIAGPFPLDRLRNDACSIYVSRPVLPQQISVTSVATYWQLAAAVNRNLDFLPMPFGSDLARQRRVDQVLAYAIQLNELGTELERQVAVVQAQLGGA